MSSLSDYTNEDGNETSQRSYNRLNDSPSIQLPASQLDIITNHLLPEHTPPTMTTDNILFSMTSSQADQSERNRNRNHSNGVRSRMELGEVNFSQLVSENGSTINDNHIAESTMRLRVIWGTNIIIKDAIDEFYLFLKEFTMAHFKRRHEESGNDEFRVLPNIYAVDVEPHYPQVFREIRNSELYSLEIDCGHLRSFPATMNFYYQLINYPQEMIAIMDDVVNKYYVELFPDQIESINNEPIQVRCFNAEPCINMRDLNPSDMDKLITIKGLVVRTSNIIPDMRIAAFECTVCSQLQAVENIKGCILEPNQCNRSDCGARNSMQLIHNKCMFSDKQLIRLQETPDMIPDGQTPHAVTLCLYDSLVDSTRPGDRIEITGIFRSSAVRMNPRQRRLRSLFRTFIDIIHLKFPIENLKADTDRESSSLDCFELNDEIKRQIIELSKRPNIYEILSASIAPSIWGLENVKKSLLLQLFGGIPKTFTPGNFSSVPNSFRGDINILLAGDPGVSKSQLLQYIHKLSPRGIYTTGKGSSAVGLTAYITRDPESRQLVLESGALVLSDGGTCCIDEFDKMSDETRAILHEAMEQQTVSVAKAGIITTLNARAAILASANPIESKYNPSRSIVENLNLPPTLLSRFDIICLILDNVHLDDDQRLAKHIVSLYLPKNDDKIKNAEIVNIDLFRNYIKYARTINPILSESASKALIDGYLTMRRLNGGSTKTISATTRQLESLIRLSEAHARVHLSEYVEEIDVKEALRLIREALLSNAIDPLTGKIDMDLLTTGKSAALRERQAELKKQVRNYFIEKNCTSITFETLFIEMNSNSSVNISESWLRDVLKELIDEEFLFSANSITNLNRRSNPIIQRNVL